MEQENRWYNGQTAVFQKIMKIRISLLTCLNSIQVLRIEQPNIHPGPITACAMCRHEREGIETVDFAEMLLVSGTVLLDDVKWLSFHSGYDFGYLLRSVGGCLLLCCLHIDSSAS